MTIVVIVLVSYVCKPAYFLFLLRFFPFFKKGGGGCGFEVLL